MRASRSGNILQHLDWTTIGLFLVLVLFGWLNIYGASYTFDQTSIFDFSNRAGKQFTWIIGSILLAIVLLLIDYKTYDVLAYIAYGAMLLLLLATPFLAHNIKGSMSWISLGPVNLQPAEFAKCIVALTVAKYMGRYEYKIRTWRDLIVPFAIIGIPAMIIMILQKETGSALVFAAFLLVFYRQGMSGYVLWLGVAAVALFILSIRLGAVPLPLGTGSVGILTCMLLLTVIEIFFICKEHRMRWQALIMTGSVAVIYGICLIVNIWVRMPFNLISMGIVLALVIYNIAISIYWRKYRLLIVAAFTLFCIGYTHACDYVFTHVLQPHQRIRIEVLLGMKEDPAGAGYNVNQARIAIGSGRFWGKGYLNGTQTKLQFVPEQDTDFIFCTVGEEWGFVGSIGVLLVYLWFILRLFVIAERQRNVTTRIYAYAVGSIFLFHLMINIGMVLGLLPVIGIPLPFFSYGGSSLWGFTLLLFILLRLDAARMEQLN
ncbi:MAG: rod shape-determining protein RodA [Paludibacteraceae bacterium]|nr:rod shape-determining protein RodA [Paludibacteraceae bacterium]MBQ6723018.1 rod shape-determining protein RodA [Paludibacteraceae bacterium]